MDRKFDRQANRKTILTNSRIENDRQTNREANRQMDRKDDRQTIIEDDR